MTYSLKTKLNYGVSVAALCIFLNGAQMQNATAADMFDQAVRPTGVIWEGGYIGVQLGGTVLDAPIEGYSEDHKGGAATGLLYGVQAGYNWQVDDAVYGLEADVALMPTENGRYDSTNYMETDTLSSLRGRLGILTGEGNDTMLFGTFGVGMITGHAEDSSSSHQLDFYELALIGGLGIEHIITENWSIKGEVLYTHVNEDFAPSLTSGTSVGFFFEGAYVARMGLNFRF